MQPTRSEAGSTARALVACIGLASSPLAAQTVGEPLPPWTPGTLDIHQINTGRGNAALSIFPDGTSLLVDAGDNNAEPPVGTPRVPDGSKPAGEWIARYALRMLAHDPEPAIDYAVVSHFHGDHMAGLADVVRHIPIRLLLDRGWPNYDYPRPAPSGSSGDAYRAFVDGQRERGAGVARLEPGRSDQIVLKRHPDRYPEFTVRNLAANGEVWTGAGNATRQHFPRLADVPDEDWPTENHCSVAIRVSYGRFDYYTGGDLLGVPDPGFPRWHAIEIPIARAAGPVEAAVLNHHGFRDATTEAFVRALRAQVWIVSARTVANPGRIELQRLLSERLYPGRRDVFAIAISEIWERALGRAVDRLTSQRGHVVLRVTDGGESFRVIVVDDRDEAGTVAAVHGPYASR